MGVTAHYHTFPIGNMTSEFGLDFSQARVFLSGVTFKVFFLVLFSLLKQNKNKWRLQTFFRWFFLKNKKRVSPFKREMHRSRKCEVHIYFCEYFKKKPTYVFFFLKRIIFTLNYGAWIIHYYNY